MRCVFKLLLLSCILLSAASFGRAIPGVDSPSERNIPIKGAFIVRFADDVALSDVSGGFGLFRLGVPSVESVFDRFNAEEVRALFPASVNKSDDLSRFIYVSIPDNQSDKSFMDAMSANPNILSIEQDVACRIAAVPNDPGQSNQWWVYQSSGVDIDARQAWDIEQGNDTAIIAIIDTGVLYNHPDLMNNIWVNPGEDLDGDMVVFDSTDINNLDSDGNGYVDDFVGYDFVSSSTNLWPGEDGNGIDNDPKDFNGHGTHCSGIAAAVTNNNYGGCGTAGGWGPLFADRGARIMCLRAGYSAVATDGGYETGLLIMSSVASAINYAVDNGADVISYSAGSSFSSALYAAVNRAMSAGIVFCHAAGNDNADSPDYFGVFPGLISVAATNPTDHRWVWGTGSGSNYGTWVEVAAPGNDIYSTVSNHYSPGFATYTGTSMACPMTAGLAALIKSHYPDYDKNEIDTLIINRADSIPDAQFLAGLLGGGRINAYNSLADAPSAAFTANKRSGVLPLDITFTDQSPSATSWTWDFGDGQGSTDPNPVHSYTSPGYYTVSLEVNDPYGTHTRVKNSYIYATADTLYADPVMVKLGEKVAVNISLKNNVILDELMLPLEFPATGSPRLTYDSFTVAGTRAENFDVVQKQAEATNGVVFYFKAASTTAKNGLLPGDGPIITAWFSPLGSGNLVIDTTAMFGTSFEYEFTNNKAAYKPAVVPFSVYIIVYERGDANGDFQVNIGDAVALISYAFRGGPPPLDYPLVYAGDANADGAVNVADAVYLISYVFRGGPPPPP